MGNCCQKGDPEPSFDPEAPFDPEPLGETETPGGPGAPFELEVLGEPFEPVVECDHHTRELHEGPGHLWDLVEDPDNFSYRGLVVWARVLSFTDGDTCTIKFDYRGEIIQVTIRMLGYNSREMRPRKTVPNRDAVIAQAKRDTKLFKSMIPESGIVEAHIDKFGVFGRTLATFYVEGVCVNDEMIRRGGGVPFP